MSNPQGAIPAAEIMPGAISSAAIGFGDYAAEDRAQRDCLHADPLEWVDRTAGVAICVICGRVFRVSESE